MTSQIKKDSLESELSAIDAMLTQLDEHDFISRQSLEYKKREISAELMSFSDHSNFTASVILAFEGGPVQGSKGIDVDFASKTLEAYQLLITKQMAAQDSQLARTGPVPFRQLARMQITDIIHGSFGFKLEESGGDQLTLIDNPMQKAIGQIDDLILTFATGNDDAYQNTLAGVDRRVFISVQSFFENLYRDSAALKIIESDRNLSVSHYDVIRGRERVAGVEVVDNDISVEGELLGLAPISRRFDFRVVRSDYLESQKILSGQVGQKLSTDYLERLHGDVRISGQIYSASITYRVAKRADGTTSESFILTDLISNHRK